MQNQQPNDDKLVALFRHHPVKNDAKTKEAGRPIFDDMEVCEIRAPGSRNTSVFPALSISHTYFDTMFGTEGVPITYAERFAAQYRQFKEQQAQTVSGTPLSHAPFLTEARRAELKALNIYTVEALSIIDGLELKNLGQGGRDMKNAALEFIAKSKAEAMPKALMEELETLRARNAILEEDFKAIGLDDPKPADDFYDMSDQQLRDYIAARSGGTVRGDVQRKTLLKMAKEATPKVTGL